MLPIEVGILSSLCDFHKEGETCWETMYVFLCYDFRCYHWFSLFLLHNIFSFSVLGMDMDMKPINEI